MPNTSLTPCATSVSTKASLGVMCCLLLMVSLLAGRRGLDCILAGVNRYCSRSPAFPTLQRSIFCRIRTNLAAFRQIFKY